MKKLPVEFKEKWVAALRSGEYKQGTGYLKNGNCYCCLGVACVISGIPIEPKQRFIYTADGIPELIQGINGVADDLSRMNDGNQMQNARPLSFAEIANYIETNL